MLSRILTGTPASHDLIIPYLPGETLTDKLEGLLSNMCALSGLQSVFHRKLGEVTPWKVPDEEGAIEAVEAEVLGNADVLECAMDELRSFRDELRAHTT